MDVRCKVKVKVEKESWSMHWSNEVLPEPTMIPDLSVFWDNVSTPKQKTVQPVPQTQLITTRSQDQLTPFSATRETSRREKQSRGPALLKLPFTLSPSGKYPRDQPGMPYI